MDRRAFIAAVALAHVMYERAARAQSTEKPWRIGILVAGGSILSNDPAAVYVQAFRDRGLVEGSDVTFVIRSANGRAERLPQLAAELVRLGVDVIVTGGSEATQAAKHATSTIPIVFSGPSYPVEEGLVTTFSRPGGNITGITVAMSDTVEKHVQLLREVAPTITSIAVIWSPQNPGHTFAFRDTERAAASVQLTVRSIPMANPSEIERAMAALERMRPDALIVQPAPAIFIDVKRIAAVVTALRIPSISIAKAFAEQGLLMSYGADFRDAPQRVVAYVDRIIKGGRPGELPVERPTRFELTINLGIAKTLGLAIPQPMLLRADTVIE